MKESWRGVRAVMMALVLVLGLRLASALVFALALMVAIGDPTYVHAPDPHRPAPVNGFG